MQLLEFHTCLTSGYVACFQLPGKVPYISLMLWHSSDVTVSNPTSDFGFGVEVVISGTEVVTTAGGGVVSDGFDDRRITKKYTSNATHKRMAQRKNKRRDKDPVLPPSLTLA